jgi:hypothetical protein
MSPVGTPGAAKRSLYLALRHAQLPVDIVNEEVCKSGVAQAQGAAAAILYSETADIFLDLIDIIIWERLAYSVSSLSDLITVTNAQLGPCQDCVRGALNHYAALYVIDPQVAESAVTAINAWVRTGGRAFLTAGAAQLNEANQTNAAAQKLIPVVQSGVWTGTRYSRHNASIFFIKEELPFAETLDEVTVLGTETTPAATLGVFAEKSIFKFTPASTDEHNITAVFTDGTPAQISLACGKGVVMYSAFHPGLAYMHPAVPRRPVDRTPDLDGFTHFVPTAFNTGARDLLASVMADVAGARPIICSNPLVEVGYVTSPVGALLPLVNWDTPSNQSSFHARENFTRATISLAALTPPPTFKTASLASCGTSSHGW